MRAGRARGRPRRCLPCGGPRSRRLVRERAPRPRPAACGATTWRSRRRARGPRVLLEDLLEGRDHVSSPSVRPGRSTLVLSDSSASTPCSPQRRARPRRPSAPRAAAVRAELEVAARQHDALRRLDGEREAVEHAVVDADRVERERSNRRGLTRGERAEVGAHASLAQPTPGESQRERAAVDGGVGGLQRERQRSDVVLVAVGQHDPAHLLRPFLQVLEVGDDRVDPQQVSAPGNIRPGVEQQRGAPPHSTTKAFRPNSPEPSEGNQPDRILISARQGR